VAFVQQPPALAEGSDGPRPGWNGPLEPCEQSVIEHAVIGGLLDREGGAAPTVDQCPIELETMQAWGKARTIRAEVLQHLLTESQWTVHAKGIRLRGVKISGPLDLESATLRCPLVLEDCYLDSKEPVVLKYSTVSLLRLVRCRLAGLSADMLVATKEIDLTRSTFTGAVHLLSADITGQLNFGGATITGTDTNNYALVAGGATITGTDTNNYALVADGVKVGGDVSLDGGFTAAGAIRLPGADITGQLNCSGATITGTDTSSNALVADGVKVGRDVSLDDGFTAAGAIRLPGADITGQLNFSGATISGTDEDTDALVADGVKVGRDVVLDDGFTADGAIRLPGADITGQLNFGGAKITGTDTDNNALVADGVKVGGDVVLDDKFTADGAIRLPGADITGQLNFHGATISGTDTNNNALVADGVKVGDDVFLKDGFTAAGAIRLPGADITGQLNFRGAKITGTDTDTDALVADGVKVGGDVFLDDGFTADGAIRLIGASVDGSLSLRQATLADPVALKAQGTRIGQQLLWAPTRAVTGLVNLDRVHVNRLDDDWSKDRAYWPGAGELRLAGFVYGGFGGKHLATCQQRLAWVQSQHQMASPGLPARFGAQPYEQLARVYRQMGHESDARQVAIARRNDLRKYGDLGKLRHTGNRLLDVTIKHGYQPLRAVGFLLLVFVAAFLLSWGAQHDAVMVPAKDTSSLHPTPTALDCRADYPCFYPPGYAVDLTIPIIKVGQAENWRINGAAAWGWAFVGGTWVITGLGWALTTLAVVGYTGLIRKD
jgi:predicted acyltransferase (DUF342 family)